MRHGTLQASGNRTVSRRSFIARGSAAAAGGILLERGCPAAAQASVPVNAEYDVIICGGGTSGLPAAIAAARAGAQVAVVERYGFLGGNAACSIMPCWHGLQEHHSGLLTEFANLVEEFGVGPSPLREGNHIEPEAVKILFQRLAQESKVALHLHHFITGAVMDADRVVAIATESKSGRRLFGAKCFVDASGDGDLCAHAGAEYNKGVGGRTQGMSLRFRVGYVNLDRFADWAEEAPAELEMDSLVRQVREGGGKTWGKAFYFGSRLDLLFGKFLDRYPDLPENTYFNCSSVRPNELSVNTTRVYDLDGTSADDLTKAEIALRGQAWAVWRFLKENVPGFETSAIIETACQAGVRESRTIIGDYVLSKEDGAANREFPDSVQTCRVQFDSHDKQKYDTGGNKGLVDVPYGVFLPKGLDAVLTAGRCTSCDHLMNSAFRRMENAFQSGEVAGTAAALAVRKQQTPRVLSVAELKETLRNAGFTTCQADRKLEEASVKKISAAGSPPVECSCSAPSADSLSPSSVTPEFGVPFGSAAGGHAPRKNAKAHDRNIVSPSPIRLDA